MDELKEESNGQSRAKRKQNATRTYPRVSIEEALKVPFKIKELNGGNPFEPKVLAEAVNLGLKSTNFYYLTAASRDFGFSEGTSRSDKISLTNLGREIVYAPNLQVEEQKKVEAFLNIEIFKKVFEHYQGSKLPEMKYLGNTLQNEFDVHPDFHEEFSNLFKENCDFLKIDKGAEKVENNLSGDGQATTIVVGEPKKKKTTDLKAFIIMPFVERNPDRPQGFFNEVLNSLFIPSGVECGFLVETANKDGSDIIQSTIINELLEADLVIADLTDHNPNVLFELGLRMAVDKPVALVKASGTGRIFDVDNMLRVFEYNSNLWQSTIKKDLPRLIDHIKATWSNKDKDLSYMKILRRQQ